MRPIGLEDVLGRERYGAERDAIRRRIIAHKRTRRVAVGDRLSFLFEDQATIWYQTQEMLWIEHITDLDAIREELAVYNEILPGPGALSATLLIEIEDQSGLREELNRPIGIDDEVELGVGGRLGVAAAFEAGRQTAEKLSAVQYVRFPLAAEARRRIAAGGPPGLAVAHPDHRGGPPLPGARRGGPAADLADPAAAEEALRRVRDGG